MYKAFLEASFKARGAIIFFLLGKVMFITTAASLIISKRAAIISLMLYAFFIFGSIVLCLLEGCGKKKKTYGELEEENRELKLKLGVC